MRPTRSRPVAMPDSKCRQAHADLQVHPSAFRQQPPPDRAGSARGPDRRSAGMRFRLSARSGKGSGNRASRRRLIGLAGGPAGHRRRQGSGLRCAQARSVRTVILKKAVGRMMGKGQPLLLECGFEGQFGAMESSRGFETQMATSRMNCGTRRILRRPQRPPGSRRGRSPGVFAGCPLRDARQETWHRRPAYHWLWNVAGSVNGTIRAFWGVFSPPQPASASDAERVMA